MSTFDGLQYIASYGDLIRAFGANEAAGDQHWISNGQREGRSADLFDERPYLLNYADLRAAYRNDLEAATTHYINFGFAEGRNDDRPPPPGFDGLQYIASHEDLIAAFGANETAGTQHYVQFGRAEGRATDTFDEEQYLANYSDLQLASGDNLETATFHYIISGIKEGRTDDPIPIAQDDVFGEPGSPITEDSAPRRLDVQLNDTSTAPNDRPKIVSVNDSNTAGTVDLSQNGCISYAPADAFEGRGVGEIDVDTFTYTVSNNFDQEATVAVTVTVTGVNDAPEAVTDVLMFSEDSGATSVGDFLLSNDTDVDQNDFRSIVSASGANVTFLAGDVVYDPGAFGSLNDGQTATDSFFYTIADAAGEESTVRSTVTIFGATDFII